MGTRADFYIGRGLDAEWLGSIAWDGYPGGIDNSVLCASDETTFRSAVAAFLAQRDDATQPKAGWPWPWDNSNTTDFSYAFDGGVQYTSFGHGWRLWTGREDDEDWPDAKLCIFPDMSKRKNVRFDRGSGLIIVRA